MGFIKIECYDGNQGYPADDPLVEFEVMRVGNVIYLVEPVKGPLYRAYRIISEKDNSALAVKITNPKKLSLLDEEYERQGDEIIDRYNCENSALEDKVKQESD